MALDSRANTFKILLSFLLSLLLERSVQSQPKLLDPSNWTSCEAFLNNTVFDPESVLDIDWKIFYFWNPDIEASYNVRFSRPSEMLLDRFRVELDQEIKPAVNWTNAELFMETSIDFSALFIKTNVSGAYRIIPSVAFDYPGVPTAIFGLKSVKPGYLGISNCKHRLCYALAPVDKMPYHLELAAAAQTLGFFSEYNRSHIDLHMGPTDPPPQFHEEADDEDEDLDVELDLNRLEMF